MRIVFYLESLRKPLRLAKGTDAVGGYGGSFSGPGDEKSLLSFLQKAAGCAGRQFAFAAWQARRLMGEKHCVGCRG